MKRVFWRALLLPAMVVLLQASSCDDTENPLAEGEEFVASITLRAILSDGPPIECIHLLVPGENFPTGQVCGASATRSATLTVKRGSSYVFRAGRNGVILDEQSCRVSTGTGTLLGVRWTGAGLQCADGFD